MKVQKGSRGIKVLIKSGIIAVVLVLTSFCCKAQEELSFPFQGGVTIMNRFFKDSLVMPADIARKAATGTVVFKFTADESGTVKKIIIYYADDYSLTPRLIEVLRKSNHKWIIPNHEKLHDFIIPFSIVLNPPANETAALQEAFYKFYKDRHPILSLNQVPINDATLLPTVVINYDFPQ